MKFTTFPWLLLLVNELLANPASYNNKYSLARTKKVESTRSETFKENLPDYPKNFIKTLDLEKFDFLFGTEFQEVLGARFDADEEGLCRSRKRTVFPQSGQTPDGSWLVIVNNDDDRYRQGVVVEECEDDTQPCAFHNHFPLSVVTRCKQSHSYRTLVAINPVTKKPFTENFLLPSCCKCMYTTAHRSNANRFGGESEKISSRRTNLSNSEAITYPVN